MPYRKHNRQTEHSWINWPNKSKRKCTVCGCICSRSNNHDTYERDGVVSDSYIECKKNDFVG